MTFRIIFWVGKQNDRNRESINNRVNKALLLLDSPYQLPLVTPIYNVFFVHVIYVNTLDLLAPDNQLLLW